MPAALPRRHAALADLLPADGPMFMALTNAPAPEPGEAPFWFLQDRSAAGCSLLEAWALALGRGVRIGLLDSGVNAAHSDFLPGQTGGAGTDPAPLADPHGTRVAGLIAGRLDNAIGGMGAATGAVIRAEQMDPFAFKSPALVAEALQRQATFEVSNNSWGWTRAFADNFLSSAFQPVASAITDGARDGRGGLGTVWVFAAGNGRLTRDGQNHGDDSNFHNLTNARQVIAVGASDATGKVAFFSSPGTNLLLVAPGQALATTDGLTAGASARTWVTGTSFAAPLVSGTVALMLEVNPALGYRDVQHILAITARPLAASPGQANGGGAVNGGGLVFSRDAGFGLLDAEAAVRLARHHSGGSTAANEASLSVTLPNLPGPPDPLRHALSVTVAAPPDGLRVEWVELWLSVTDPALRLMSVELVSPSGMRALIAPNFSTLGSATRLDFRFSSLATWGEDVAGEWTLVLSHPEGADNFSLHGAALQFFGTSGGDDGQRWFTDDWAVLASNDPARQSIRHDATVPGTLNFAATRTAVSVDLGQGLGLLGDVAFSLDSSFATVIGGAGSDMLRGGAGADRLIGDDGADLLAGSHGDDTLEGGTGNDTLVGGPGNDSIAGGIGTDRLFGGPGNDTLAGGEGHDRLLGGDGDDRLIGGPGRDRLIGGAGADVFVFAPGDTHGPTGRDRIEDFTPGLDRLDLSALGPDLQFVGTAAFSGTAGEIRFLAQAGRLAIDLDGDRIADFSLTLAGIGSVTTDDLIL